MMGLPFASVYLAESATLRLGAAAGAKPVALRARAAAKASVRYIMVPFFVWTLQPRLV